MTLTEFMVNRYKNREDKDNIFCVGVSDAEFRMFIINYLLGEDWYVTDPIGQTQVNEIALDEILNKYSKRYRKECKQRKIMSETPTINELNDELIKNYELMTSNLRTEIDCYKKINEIHKLMLENRLGTVIDQDLIDKLYPKETNNNVQ